MKRNKEYGEDRMKAVIFLLLCAFIVCAGCSDSTGPDSESNGDTGGEVLVTSTIGAGGGEIGTEDITLKVESGTMPGDREISIALAAEQYESDDTVTPTYTISNISSDFSAPMEISLAYDGELSNETVIAVGVPITLDDGAEVTDYFYIPAEQTGDVLTGTLYPLLKESVSTEKPAAEIAQAIVLSFFGLSDIQYYSSPQGLTKFAYPLKYADVMPAIGSYIEDSHTLFQDMGFHNAPKEQDWRKLDRIDTGIYKFYVDDKYTRSYVSFDWWRDDDDPYGYVLRLNENKLSQVDEKFKEAIGRAVFGYQSYICTIAYNSAMDWFHRAAKTWVGELVLGNPDYVPDEFHGNELEPLKGLARLDAPWAEREPYYDGMSAFVEYLCDTKYDTQKLVDIYNVMWDGEQSIGVLQDGIGTSSDIWWSDFMKAYIDGSVYNVAGSTFLENVDGTFTIAAEDDTLTTFVDQYAGLSAKLYRINLEYADIDTSSTITCSVNTGNTTILIYGVKGATLEYFDEAPEIEVAKLKDLTDAGYDLLAVVVYSGYSTNLTKYTEISLRLEVDAAPPIDLTKFNYCYISVYYFTFYYSDGSINDIGNYSWQVGGSFDGNTWRGSGKSVTGSTTTEVDITVEIDFDTMTVTSFTADRHMYGEYIDTEYTIRGHDIPLYDYSEAYTQLLFDKRGTDAKDALNYLTYDSEYQTLGSYDSPREDSGIRIQIYHKY